MKSRKHLEEKIFEVRSVIADLVVKKEELEKLLEHNIDERTKSAINNNLLIVEKEINNRKAYLRTLKRKLMNKIKNNNNKKKIKNNKNKNDKPDVNRMVIEKMKKIMEEVKNIIKPSPFKTPFKKQKEQGKAPVKNKKPQTNKTNKGSYRPFECLRELLA